MILPTYFRATTAHPIDDTPSGLMAELLERVMGTPVRPYRADMKEAERRATQRLMHYAVCSLAARGVRYCDEACAVQVRVYLATDTSTVPTIGFTDLGGEIIDDAKSLWTIVTYRASSMEHMRARRMMETPPSSQPR